MPITTHHFSTKFYGTVCLLAIVYTLLYSFLLSESVLSGTNLEVVFLFGKGKFTGCLNKEVSVLAYKKT